MQHRHVGSKRVLAESSLHVEMMRWAVILPGNRTLVVPVYDNISILDHRTRGADVAVDRNRLTKKLQKILAAVPDLAEYATFGKLTGKFSLLLFEIS